jgi:hypothetical protein
MRGSAASQRITAFNAEDAEDAEKGTASEGERPPSGVREVSPFSAYSALDEVVVPSRRVAPRSLTSYNLVPT